MEEDRDWRYNPFLDHHREPPHFHSGLPLYDAHTPAPDYNVTPVRYNQRQAADYDNHEDHDTPARYESFDERRTPTFESALRFPYEPAEQLPRPPVDGPSSISALFSRTSGLQRPRGGNMASSAPRRFAGDGYDYRRPVSSAAREQDAGSVDLSGDDRGTPIDLSGDEVIDLTADDSGYGASQDGNGGRQGGNREEQSRSRRTHNVPRLPRGMDIIIDLDNGEEEWNVDSPAAEPGSPDIEFISSRQLSPRPVPRPFFADNNPDSDEVEFVRENALPADEVRRRRDRERELENVMEVFGTRFTHLRAQVDRFNAQINRTANRFQEPIVPNRRGHAHVHVGAFVAPLMDFEAVAFEIGPRVRAAEPPPPTYDAPPKAPEGFTRSPEEEGELVCPNCGDELCTGSSEVKRQVWLVKGCGHVSSLLDVCIMENGANDEQ
jgi:hypothetical protein